MKRLGYCPVCLASNSEWITDHGLDLDGETVRACRTCSAFFLDPRLTTDELAAYYNSDYYSIAYRGSRSPDQKARQARRGPASRRAKYLRRRSFLRAGRRVLELGCGAGDFLEEVRRSGALGYGVEPSSGYAEDARCRGLAVETGTYPHVSGPLERYDVIAMFHVLEHLPDPRGTLVSIRAQLTESGVVVIEVPDLRRALRVRWTHRYFHRPHLVDFTRESLYRLLNDVGFEVLSSAYPHGRAKAHHLLVIAGPTRCPATHTDPTDIEQFIMRVKRRVALSRALYPAAQAARNVLLRR